jgi:hypothetical protein
MTSGKVFCKNTPGWKYASGAVSRSRFKYPRASLLIETCPCIQFPMPIRSPHLVSHGASEVAMRDTAYIQCSQRLGRKSRFAATVFALQCLRQVLFEAVLQQLHHSPGISRSTTMYSEIRRGRGCKYNQPHAVTIMVEKQLPARVIEFRLADPVPYVQSVRGSDDRQILCRRLFGSTL